MTNHKVIHCTVTNDLNQDQRMHRICTTLQSIGYEVILLGRQKHHSPSLLDMPFQQKRIFCFFNKGLLFYGEYNLKLFWYFLWHKQDYIYSVDSDTILPGVLAKIIKGKKLIFDAHEYFTEVPELKDRSMVKKVWSLIEHFCIPQVNLAITVNESLANIFSNKYKIPFYSLYNVTLVDGVKGLPNLEDPYILYQGVLNKGRGLEALICAMENIQKVKLIIAGEGDLSADLRAMANSGSLKEKVLFKGWQSPSELKKLTSGALLGINLLEDSSLNYYYSLANKFFDYMHAAVPSVNMNFPEYARIMEEYNVGYLLENVSPKYISETINGILQDTEGLELRRVECQKATQKYQWQVEAIKLQNMLNTI
jgi:glycosyltransferase involved in cell wall biosynthesis